MSSGPFVALGGALAKFRKNFGTTFTLTGTTVGLPCSSTAAEGDKVPFVPDGDRNAAEPDNRVFAFALAVGQGVVVQGSTGIWSGNGQQYSITMAKPTQEGTTWRCIGYRTPQQGTSSANPTNSNGAW